MNARRRNRPYTYAFCKSGSNPWPCISFYWYCNSIQTRPLKKKKRKKEAFICRTMIIMDLHLYWNKQWSWRFYLYRHRHFLISEGQSLTALIKSLIFSSLISGGVFPHIRWFMLSLSMFTATYMLPVFLPVIIVSNHGQKFE